MYKALAAVLTVLLITSCNKDKTLPVEPAPPVQAEAGKSIVVGDQTVMVPKKLTLTQNQLLNTAYAIARADGHDDPSLIQGVLLQETKAGGVKSYKVAGPANDKYYGLMQIKLGSAQEVMGGFPKLWSKYNFHTRTDDELKANLILNEAFNIEIGSKYMKMLHQKYGFSGRELVNAYNRGPGGVKSVDNDYYYAVEAEKKLVAFKH